MPSFLDEVLAHKRSELKIRKENRPLNEFQESVRKGTGSFKKALEGDGLKLIAELKPRSPALGDLDTSNNFDSRLQTYDKYAQAVSVLCDERYFGGSVELLNSITKKIKAPTLLKDFVIDPYQLYEGRFAGAEAALLIVKILSQGELIELHQLCCDLGLTPVLEVQTEEELKLASEAVAPEVILVNNRNLDTLKIELTTVEKLAPLVDPKAILIAASGIETEGDMLSIRPFASRFLIGSSLMKSRNPQERFEAFLAAENSYQTQLKKESKSCR